MSDLKWAGFALGAAAAACGAIGAALATPTAAQRQSDRLVAHEQRAAVRLAATLDGTPVAGAIGGTPGAGAIGAVTVRPPSAAGD